MDSVALQHQRHTLAHLLAAAIRELYPHALPTIGPAIDTGFYYDFDFSHGIAPTEKDFPIIEAKMRELLPGWTAFERLEISAPGAHAQFDDNAFKQELIADLEARGETITLYTSGGFTDLCRGGHSENPAAEIEPESFMLDKIAGAYWRGDERNKMLTRIYGLAFATKAELNSFEAQREEAGKRDHRILGKQLDLFALSELVGGGLPLFTPKGTLLRELLASYSQELQGSYGFERVWTPHMARTELYKYSGHYDKYPERFEVTSSESDDVFMLKPMNCPHHAQLFARKPWSYRELPVRYMENTTNYRDEKHGELHGLSRVRSLSQDDGHVFCQESHMEEEIRNIVQMVRKLYASLGLDYYVRLSFRDDSDKFLGDFETWNRAESVISKVAKDENLKTIPGPGEAAFYGPKLDYMVLDALGREWQCATIQLDFIQPERFGLSYVDTDGKDKRPVMIHKALLGSIERFISVYIEHTAGAFPLWLSPVQAALLPVSDKHDEYARAILEQLKAAGIRAELKTGDSLGKRIREAKLQKAPYTLVVGDAEIEGKTATLESREAGKIGALSVEEIIAKLSEEIKSRAA